MTVLFSVFIWLGMFACALPAGVYSVIWERISENLTVGIPFISLLRTLLAFSVIVAVIVSDRVREYHWQRDIMIMSAALEAVSLFGFSMSRVLWHLAACTMALGFGMGMGMSLLYRMVRTVRSSAAALYCSGTGFGAACGVWILSLALGQSGSWRTACQILAIILAVLCLVLFLMRHKELRGLQERVRTVERNLNISRSRRRMARIEQEGDVDETYRQVYFVKAAFSYAASLLTGILILEACLWPASWFVAENAEGYTTPRGIIYVCLGIAAGRVISGLLKLEKEKSWALGFCVAGAVLGISAAALPAGHMSDAQVMALQFAAGFGGGLVIPGLIMADDERLDSESERSLVSLVPAFCAGSWALITPLTQALVGSGAEHRFALLMLMTAAADSFCLMMASGKVRK